MFTNLLFLILAMLVMDLSPSNAPGLEVSHTINLFFIGIASYFLVIFLIYLQNLPLKKAKNTGSLILSQIELIIFLLFVYNVLGVQNNLPSGAFIQLIFNLIMAGFYFFGLGVHYYYAPHKSHAISQRTYCFLQIRFLIPFVIPFFAYQLLIDLLLLVPIDYLHFNLIAVLEGGGSLEANILIGSILFLFFLFIFLVFPYFIQTIWKCDALPNSSLKFRLEALCEKAQFHHSGLKIWNVMRHSLTAAIIGIIPKYRYVMFTEPLIKQFPEEELEAILAHEIGHSHYKHLIFYPFIFFGMMILLGLVTDLLWIPIMNYWKQFSQTWGELGFYLSIFILLTAIICLYFRFIFGYFSRLFERQADLHVLDLNLSPYALINALNRIGVINGYTHEQPSWHHGSIRQRMNFIKTAIEQPQYIQKHHKKVRIALALYSCLFIIVIVDSVQNFIF